jgi:hypothetical protein
MRLCFEGGPWDMRILNSRAEHPPATITYGLDDADGIYICAIEASNPASARYLWREPESQRAARHAVPDEAAE